MNTVTLFKDDLANTELSLIGCLGLSWNGLLEQIGVETHTLVDGRWIDRKVDSVEIVVRETSAFDENGDRLDEIEPTGPAFEEAV
jgi:hypothetical protein